MLLSSLFYLPVAGLIASITAWLLLEPHFNDMSEVGGRVVLVNLEPFEFDDWGSSISLTVGHKEVVVVPGSTRLEPGADGQRAFGNAAEIEGGDVVEACGQALDHNRILAFALRPATEEHAVATGQEIAEDPVSEAVFFPVTAALIGLALLLAEGVASRNWLRMMERAFIGTLLTLVFAWLSLLPASLAFSVGGFALRDLQFGEGVEAVSGVAFIAFAACRSVAWACIGAALGVGMNLARSTKVQLRNSVLGGALGGALGGVFFDPIDRFATTSAFGGAWASRLVGMIAVGVAVGVFVALVDRLAREAWVVVRTGPLAGKSFVLYKTPTMVGSAPQSDIYLFKDAEIDGAHAAIHRVGNAFEVEDMGSRTGIRIGGQSVRRRRLASGDQIVLGATVLQFEERSKGRTHE